MSYVSPRGPHQGGHAAAGGLHRRAVSAQQREHGLSVVARANRWMLSGAVLLAGAATAVTAHAFQAQNKSRSASTLVTHTGAHHHSDDVSPTAAPSPAASPAPSAAPAPAPAPVVSGGS